MGTGYLMRLDFFKSQRNVKYLQIGYWGYPKSGALIPQYRQLVKRLGYLKMLSAI